ncbi:hypothetical protein K9N68_37285 (plasmid) [Kovacikia minuta CCNUW1]|uniref:hypothetical protein n=1 Tax=Kovacikia minuta TaxID=2931930 RepID=UPI001CCD6D72|nr:hypothetical protein [Kovacikia minuta]UBF29867.1 hypothetical protein K9N68_37285 [Kovacikia minuta CCNUW1]
MPGISIFSHIPFLSPGGGGGGFPPLRRIAITGQSLSIGISSGALLTTGQIDGGYMLPGGTYAQPPVSAPLVPLNATSVSERQTIALSATKLLYQLYGQSARFIFSNVGVSGASYTSIRKGGSSSSYANQLLYTTAISANAAPVGIYQEYAFCLIHGETDTKTSVYDLFPALLLSDLRADINPSGKLFLCQVNSHNHSSTGGGGFTPLSLYAQVKAHYADPSNVILVCSKYMLDHADGLHSTANALLRLGEYYAYAMYRTLTGNIFSPLKPVTIQASGNPGTGIYTTVITYSVPDNGSLVLDTSLVSDPGSYGFIIYDEKRIALTLSGFRISGNQLEIDSSGGIPFLFTYALTSTGVANAGPTTGSRGCLRSSTAAPSTVGNTNYHYAIASQQPINNANPFTPPGSIATTNLLSYWQSNVGVTESSNLISNWQSSDASLNNFVQATGAAQPLLVANQLNGFPAIRFASGDVMTCTLPSTVNAVGFDHFLVFKLNSSPPNFGHIFAGKAAATANYTAVGEAFTSYIRSLTGFGFPNHFTFTPRWKGVDRVLDALRIPQQWIVVAWRVFPDGSTTTFEVWINQVLVFRLSTGATTLANITLDSFRIPGDNSNNLDLAAIVTYSATLSNSDFWQTYNHLMNRYAVSFDYQ